MKLWLRERISDVDLMMHERWYKYRQSWLCDVYDVCLGIEPESIGNTWYLRLVKWVLW